jgi:hypothetical protein
MVFILLDPRPGSVGLECCSVPRETAVAQSIHVRHVLHPTRDCITADLEMRHGAIAYTRPSTCNFFRRAQEQEHSSSTFCQRTQGIVMLSSQGAFTRQEYQCN